MDQALNPVEHITPATLCDLCGSSVIKTAFPIATGKQELLGVSIALSTVICRHCYFIYQLERFSDSLLSALYEQDTSFAFGDSEKDLPSIKSCLSERQAVISNAMNAHGVKDGAVILDVGGGRGECCQHLVRQHRVVVADTTASAPIDHRIDKVPGLFSADLNLGSFDVVVMNHVLEHVFSPTTFLKSAFDMLGDGGTVIIEVPFELYTPIVGRKLGDWRHVAYFCKATMRHYLKKAGFKVTRIVSEEGCYGVRRLPVIRATARKDVQPAGHVPIRNSPLALAIDMLSPAVLVSLVKSRFGGR
jgi:SAM-dependent methyltransferase